MLFKKTNTLGYVHNKVITINEEDMWSDWKFDKIKKWIWWQNKLGEENQIKISIGKT